SLNRSEDAVRVRVHGGTSDQGGIRRGEAGALGRYAWEPIGCGEGRRDYATRDRSGCRGAKGDRPATGFAARRAQQVRPGARTETYCASGTAEALLAGGGDAATGFAEDPPRGEDADGGRRGALWDKRFLSVYCGRLGRYRDAGREILRGHAGDQESGRAGGCGWIEGFAAWTGEPGGECGGCAGLRNDAEFSDSGIFLRRSTVARGADRSAGR